MKDIEKIIKEFDEMFPLEKEDDFFRFRSHRLVIRNFLRQSLTSLQLESLEEIEKEIDEAIGSFKDDDPNAKIVIPALFFIKKKIQYPTIKTREMKTEITKKLEEKEI